MSTIQVEPHPRPSEQESESQVVNDFSIQVATVNGSHVVGQSGFRFAIDTITNETVLDRLASESDLIFHLAVAVGVKLIVEKPVHAIETKGGYLWADTTAPLRRIADGFRRGLFLCDSRFPTTCRRRARLTGFAQETRRDF